MPNQVEARLLLGQVYLALDNAKTAEDQFAAALLLKPASIEGRLGIAKAQIAQGNFNGAMQQLEAISKSQPRNAEVFGLLAQAYSALGKKADSERAAARARSLRTRK